MRDYEVYVPRDSCASKNTADSAFALTQTARVRKADVRSRT